MTARVFRTAARALAKSALCEWWDLSIAATAQTIRVRLHEIREQDFHDSDSGYQQVVTNTKLVGETAFLSAIAYDDKLVSRDGIRRYAVVSTLDKGGGNTVLTVRIDQAVPADNAP